MSLNFPAALRSPAARCTSSHCAGGASTSATVAASLRRAKFRSKRSHECNYIFTTIRGGRRRDVGTCSLTRASRRRTLQMCVRGEGLQLPGSSAKPMVCGLRAERPSSCTSISTAVSCQSHARRPITTSATGFLRTPHVGAQTALLVCYWSMSQGLMWKLSVDLLVCGRVCACVCVF